MARLTAAQQKEADRLEAEENTLLVQAAKDGLDNARMFAKAIFGEAPFFVVMHIYDHMFSSTLEDPKEERAAQEEFAAELRDAKAYAKEWGVTKPEEVMQVWERIYNEEDDEDEDEE